MAQLLETRRFIFDWPADIPARCRITNATGTWRHGAVFHEDGYELRESIGAGGVALWGATEGVAAELRAQGIEYSVVYGAVERS